MESYFGETLNLKVNKSSVLIIKERIGQVIGEKVKATVSWVLFIQNIF